MYRVMRTSTTTIIRNTIDGMEIAPPSEGVETYFAIVAGAKEVCALCGDISPEQADAIDAAVRNLDATAYGDYCVRYKGMYVADEVSAELAEAIRDALGSDAQVGVFPFK